MINRESISRFLDAFSRLCWSEGSCADCIVSKNRTNCSISDQTDDEREDFIDTVLEWAKEHPKITIKDEFLKKYPNSPWKQFCGKGSCYYTGEECPMIMPCSHCMWWHSAITQQVKKC